MPRFSEAFVLAFLLAGGPAFAGDGNWPSSERMEKLRNWNPKIGPIQQPGEIKKGGEIQTPGEIQAPKGVEAVKSTATECETHIGVLADALFDFDKADLRADAESTLEAAIPEIRKATEGGKRPARVEGHTDGKGSEAYNMRLSEARARSVRDWLVRRDVLPASADIAGYGKSRPIAPNTLEDGSDNPEGRQKNRRVEIAVEMCKG
jgi:outer membrane protein OmpA-like peptidoglycan-associated protein